jgi:hypothetical protein
VLAVGIKGSLCADARPDYGYQIHGFRNCPNAITVPQKLEIKARR